MTILYFIIAISILVVVHEYGHYWVARRCGVHVIRFSVGFGKPLWSWRNSSGTEFSVAPIPLGGYVKMLDEREAPVPDALLSQTFNRKPPWQRIAIALAGPVANFIFAVLAYAALQWHGVTGLIPVVGSVEVDSPASLADVRMGDEIVAINGRVTATWEDVNWQLLSFIGEDADIVVSLKRDGMPSDVMVSLRDWLTAEDMPNPLLSLGVRPRQVPIPAMLADVLPNSAAERAGLRAGDEIVSVNGVSIDDWYALTALLQRSAEQMLMVEIRRAQGYESLLVVPDSRTTDSGDVQGYIGARVQAPAFPATWLTTSNSTLWQSMQQGWQKTYELIGFTLASLWKMVAGDVSVKNLSGPITIAKVAGDTASSGWMDFVGFLALLSVSLGVLNLLPIPMLDGGHIVFYLVEMMRGKPVPESVQMVAIQIGFAVLIGLMLIAFYNDISRL
ncbi:MAG: RIP metalloprotease RseP [Bacterioplanes sp.]|nr:RIP metalloprotease RseP [Bacterioplanes sp.]